MKPVEIQRAGPEHGALILTFAESFHLEDGHPLAPSGPAAIATLLRGSPLGNLYLVKEGGVGVGYFALCYTMSLEFGGLVVILDDLYFLPAARGRGLGTMVLAAVEEEALKLGAVQIFLEVEEANQRAFALYQRCGFRKRHRHMMERPLAGGPR
jgi:GNAT superfamily N-acetyltransferase